MVLQNYRVHGKWILAGEHSVLRGASALVFPVKSKYLDLSYDESDCEFTVEFENPENDLHIGFWSVFEKALGDLGKTRNDLRGKITLKNNIPIGAGMGASATLCVALAKFFHHLKFVGDGEVFNFAKKLEDLFHGQSSGVDVAVALNNCPLSFNPPESITEFKPNWIPHFYLSFSGKRAVTADCVKKVEKLFTQDEAFAKSLDSQMREAVDQAKQALEGPQDTAKLVEAIGLAEKCFEGWSLIGEDLRSHIDFLKKQGALAVKPTGSGDGGYVLSLWDRAIDAKDFPFEILACH